MDDAMTALPLVFDAPRRGKPPLHLADLTREEARAAVTELGQPAFRADQLARHFYRGVTDPAQMTDVPAAAREALTEALLPGLLTPVRHQTADNGRTRKTLWRLHDGALASCRCVVAGLHGRMVGGHRRAHRCHSAVCG